MSVVAFMKRNEALNRRAGWEIQRGFESNDRCSQLWIEADIGYFEMTISPLSIATVSARCRSIPSTVTLSKNGGGLNPGDPVACAPLPAGPSRATVGTGAVLAGEVPLLVNVHEVDAEALDVVRDVLDCVFGSAPCR